MDWFNILSNGCIFFTVVMFSTGMYVLAASDKREIPFAFG